MTNKKITKLNEYFYMNPEGEIFKYKNIVLLMIVKISSFNYSGEKSLLYCNDYKLDKMVNIKKDIFYVKNIISLI